MYTLIGRIQQIEELKAAIRSPKPEMVAVTGRRRIGKTFLIRQVCADRISFELTGIQHGDRALQLQNFTFSMAKYFPEYDFTRKPDDWLTAFNELSLALDTTDIGEKRVIFLDELPWLGTRRSGFIKGLGYFWNSWASKRNIVLIVCGSAASWVIDKVINDKGGLHNRVTKLISLPPFTLAETEAFCQSRGIRLNRFQILQIQMTIGGVPMYLDQLKPGLSAIQNIQNICFEETGYLRKEFDRLFSSLFNKPERHLLIIRALATKRRGLSRDEIISATKLPNGGALTANLDELEQSGFISIYGSYKKRSRDKLYRLTDAYSLFYLNYIESLRGQYRANFLQLSDLPHWASWSGYAFENVCLSHLTQIQRALGISGISTIVSTFLSRPTEDTPGAQIDLLIDRSDHSINVCEAKFTAKPFRLTKTVIENLERKKHAFARHTDTSKHLFSTLITTYGPVGSDALRAQVDQVVSLDDLFL